MSVHQYRVTSKVAGAALSLPWADCEGAFGWKVHQTITRMGDGRNMLVHLRPSNLARVQALDHCSSISVRSLFRHMHIQGPHCSWFLNHVGSGGEA